MLIRFLVVLGMIFASACSDDEVAGTASTNNATTSTEVRDQQTIPNLPETCDGCMDEGVCVPGTERNSCGSTGGSCDVCRDAEECSDRVCVPRKTCTPDTCTGCCNDADECITGTEALACGTGGTSCEACTDGAACIDQRCTASCGPDNCGGCCDVNGQCVTATDNATCGAGGAACQDCSATGSTCSGTGCVAPACSASCTGCCMGDTCVIATTNAQCGNTGTACMACPNGQSCTNSVCVVDMTTTSGLWDVVLIDGQVDYYDYDYSTPPDTFMYVYFQDLAIQTTYYYKTYTDWDTYSPVWNETIDGLSTDTVLNGFVFEMWDYDDFSANEEICTLVGIPTMADLGGPIITTVCTEYPSVKVRWKIVAHP